ncbi:ATPase [Thermosipho sp. 1063]|uniref:ATPase n=1 Tax=unclassified Thermosipho (in: thermotogales) TaxID=2676525 RepID=UPI0009494D64|nr:MULTISPECIES: ATPase [unclassified Thermosipho (in: thermotogales)]ANQ53659.1 ATPase [Thermosipho sp. 1070]APT72105.1 ATPase [Thermosipho sp. 1063]OOC44225.1 ATPase [Thermosipho sp. 1074]
MGLSEVIKYIVDKPLELKEKSLLVDRSKEIKYLNNIIKYHPFGIFGISGETGIGKTTVLNFIKCENVFSQRITLTFRESVESILYDLLYNLSKGLEKDKKLSKFAKETKEWVIEEVSTVKVFSLGISLYGSANTNLQKSKTPRFNFFAAKEKLGELLRKIVSVKGKFALIIDELDKESKSDTLQIVDALKNELLFENIITIMTLPYSIYREYKFDRLRWNESGNLENIFKDIILLEELTDSDIKELLLRRIHKFIDIIPSESLDPIIEFADGNPRDALWMLSKVIFENIEKDILKKEDTILTIKKITNEYLTELKLTPLQKKAFELLKDLTGSRDEFLTILQQNNIKRTTAYSILNTFIERKIIITKGIKLKFSGKYKFLNL